jgi:hypothetical protein
MPTLTIPDLSKIELPTLADMPKLDDLPKVDVSKMDVGKAVAEAATAVGLMQKPRSRWPFVVGAGIALAVAGWAWMNAEMIRERLSGAGAWIGDRVGAIRDNADNDESIAFTAAEPAPVVNDYPNGFGAPAEMHSTTGEDILALDEVTAKA